MLWLLLRWGRKATTKPDLLKAVLYGAIAGLCFGTAYWVRHPLLALGAAAHRVPVVIDGFISTAGALIAAGLAPLSHDYMLAAHTSAELGHCRMLDHLGLVPCLDFDLRLGEGTGAALVLSVVEAACKILDEMATFESAGISDAV